MPDSRRCFVAIDPGSRVLGLAALAPDRGAPGVGLRVLESRSLPVNGRTSIERLCSAGLAVETFMQEHRPDAAAWEEGYLGANIQTGLFLAELRGIVIYTTKKYCGHVVGGQRGEVLSCLGVVVPMLARGEAKRIGAEEAARRRRHNNDALKFAVRRRVQQLLILEDLPLEDEADALALGIWLAERESSKVPF